MMNVKKSLAPAALVWTVAVLAASAATGQGPESQAKILPVPLDPARETVLVGRTLTDGMIIQLEFEPAKGMWMAMGNPVKWSEHAVAMGELYHVEVKPIDPRSKTRISSAQVKFQAINRDTGHKVKGMLHPMWGGSGLHYAMNSGLGGDGAYVATVTVGVPTFARDPKNKNLWMKPAAAKFHFRLAGGRLTEVSKPGVD